METCVILYGEVRTLEITILSIKRLFREILNFDIYVIINLNNNDDIDHVKHLIIDMLNPKILKFVYNNELNDIVINLNNISNTYFEITKINFNEYKLLPFKETYYAIDEIKKYNIKTEIEKIKIENIKKFPYNSYIEDKLIYNIFKELPDDKYDRVFLIRTDCMWFENYNDRQFFVYQKEHGFREKTAIKNEYNNIIVNLNFDELKNKILNSSHNVLCSFFNNTNLNLKIPNAHSRILKYNDLKKIFNLFLNYDDLISMFNKYPILYPHWDGELYQKRIYEFLNLQFENDFFLHNYCSLIREK